MKSRCCFAAAIFALALGATGGNLPQTTNMTAFALAKAGNQFIAPEAKDKMTQMHSEKSDASLAPEVWYVEYMDPSVAFKETEVKFVAGKVMEVRHPKRVLDAFSGTRLLEWKRLKIDSDRALAIARGQPELKGVSLQAAQFWLERSPQGASWRIHFWAGQPGPVDDIGEIWVSAKNGAVLKNKLRPREPAGS